MRIGPGSYNRGHLKSTQSDSRPGLPLMVQVNVVFSWPTFSCQRAPVSPVPEDKNWLSIVLPLRCSDNLGSYPNALKEKLCLFFLRIVIDGCSLCARLLLVEVGLSGCHGDKNFLSLPLRGWGVVKSFVSESLRSILLCPTIKKRFCLQQS